MSTDFAAAGDGIAALTTQALAPLFWPPARLGVQSAWYGHVPFAHWLVTALRPASIVELGAHNGVSYAAFCEAVLRARIDCRCLAIDTWQGDEHAGFYGEQVYTDLKRFHDARYGAFSTLLRARFDEALSAVPDASIDLLHIDGRHRLEDVTADFTQWRPKLSPRAVVLFHDTNVREGDFGVWRLWEELRASHRNFEFLHAHGLGVLAAGPDVPAEIARLCTLNDGAAINEIRTRFALLGERWVAARDLQDEQASHAEAARALTETHAWASQAQAKINTLWPEHTSLLKRTQETRAALAEARARIAALEHALTQAEHAAAADAATRFSAPLQQAHDHIAALQAERRALLTSSSWKLTAPLRRLRGGGTQHFVPDLAPPAPLAQTATPAIPAFLPAAPSSGKILFISGEPHTPGNLYRVERYVAAARALGFTAHWMPAEPVGPPDLENLHAVILWRLPHGAHVQGIIEYCRARGTLIIFDVDDLMFRPELAVIDIIDGIRSQNFSELQTQAFFTLIGRTLTASDAVTCPTAELAHEARRLGRPACVMPNGFDTETHRIARQARAEWRRTGDDLLRIGYAGGSRTHQRDFAEAAPAIARVLREIPQARLVIFRDPASSEGLVLMHEFPEFDDLADRIEWRDMVKLPDLPRELARFTVNIAPLEAGNPFCEAKSELKYFESALAGVPTIASPAGPFARAIKDGVTGFLAAGETAWHTALVTLLTDPARRARMAQDAYHDALAQYDPYAQIQAFSLMLGQIQGGLAGAAAFERAQYRHSLPRPTPPYVPESEILWHTENHTRADVTIIVPLYKYADLVGEALASAAAQTLADLDLVVIDDASPDDSGDMALHWLRHNAGRFGRATLLRHTKNAGLGFARNSGFAAAETEFVLPLDADNRLLPAACATLHAALSETQAGFAYPAIKQFGDKSAIFGTERFSVLALQQGNFIDAMALVRKSAWAAASGYDHVQFGWEDYDFWCRLAERGHFGLSVPQVLAEYRVHGQSMLHTTTEIEGNREALVTNMATRHTWLDLSQTPRASGVARRGKSAK